MGMSMNALDERLILLALNKALYNYDDDRYEQIYRENFDKQGKIKLKNIQQGKRNELHFYIYGTEKGQMRDIIKMKKQLKELRKWHQDARQKLFTKA